MVKCSWANREVFVASAATNLPMVWPLLKHWLSLITGSISLFPSSRSDKIPTGFRTIGGGDGNPNPVMRNHRMLIPSVNPLPSKLTITGVEDQTMEDQIEINDMMALGGHNYEEHLYGKV